MTDHFAFKKTEKAVQRNSPQRRLFKENVGRPVMF
jgi:hypothetical protein